MIGLMGTPTGQARAIAGISKGTGAATYVWVHIAGGAVQRKLLRFDFDARDVMTHYTMVNTACPLPPLIPGLPGMVPVHILRAAIQRAAEGGAGHHCAQITAGRDTLLSGKRLRSDRPRHRSMKGSYQLASLRFEPIGAIPRQIRVHGEAVFQGRKSAAAAVGAVAEAAA